MEVAFFYGSGVVQRAAALREAWGAAGQPWDGVLLALESPVIKNPYTLLPEPQAVVLLRRWKAAAVVDRPYCPLRSAF